MKNKKLIYEISINLIIFIIICSPLIYFYTNPVNGINNLYITLFMIFQTIFIIYLIKKNYSYPLDELNDIIRQFMSGNSKGKEIKINNNFLNPQVKFTMNFLDFILNSVKNIKDEFLNGKAIKSEVQLATELQEKLLNKKIEHIPSLEVIAKSTPAGEIGGDSYDVIKEGNNFYIYVGDATGHGVGAGFVMVMVNALISGFAKIFKSGAQVVAYTNEILKPRIKSNILMSLLLIRWDEKEKRLFMTGSGHEYLIIYKHKLKKCFMVKSGGLALGMTKNIHKIVKEQEIKFEQNDIVVMYTDGITEAINQNYKNGNEQMFGEDRLVKAIENAPNVNGKEFKSATSIFNNVTIELSKFMGYKHKQFDDITLAVVHYRGEELIENDFSKEIHKDFITEWNWDK
ncbi:MAG: serine/threonine-protein phosphatase [Candidatus Gracilibacteria bacterium]|nr:serine/threonine-protein phosphatase [Candidatus Gracilibacteria bacterium]